MSNLSNTLKAGVAALALTSVVAVPALAAAQTAVPVPPPSYQADDGYGAPDQGYGDQGYGPDDQGYGDQGYADQGQGYDGQGQGYDGQGYGPPPPPPQAVAGSNRPEDRAYAQKYAEWQRQRADYDRYQYGRCVQKRQGATVAGALIGGIAGAVIGSNIAPRWDRTGGAVAGGALGAVAGGAIGNSAGTSAECPPGYAYGPGYVAAPYGPYYGAPVVGVGVGIGYGPRFYRPYKPYRGYRHGYWRRW